MTVLITGGSGYLGINLAKRLVSRGKVYIAARDHKRLQEAADLSGAKPIPIDCSNLASVRDVFHEIRPQTVIHAGATKYVDWSEVYPNEAIDINIVGSQNVLRACSDFSVRKLIGISTDKAAPPVANTYGLTKAVMERLYVTSAHKKSTNTLICIVRYGNVLWSTGSFLPQWMEMIRNTNHIQTTGSEMTRFFFSVEEAVDLVLTASDNLDKINGSILSLPMKTACVKDFLSVACELSGASYSIIDSRPGERMHEYLVGDAELPFSRKIVLDNKEYFSITPNIRSSCQLESPVCSNSSDRLSSQQIRAYLKPFAKVQ